MFIIRRLGNSARQTRIRDCKSGDHDGTGLSLLCIDAQLVDDVEGFVELVSQSFIFSLFIC
jgi:hypothetical protein